MKSNSTGAVLTNLTVVWVPWARCPKVPLTVISRAITLPTNWSSEGIEGRVAYKGRLKEIIHQQMGGLRSCMGLTGCGTIDELRTKAEFVRISGAGIQESHVHDVTITKESPNYRLGS